MANQFIAFVLLFALGTLSVSLPSVYADDQTPSLGELGITPTELKGNPELQVQLIKRESMLKTHQTLGLITVLPMIATVILGGNADHNAGQRNVHMALGITTAAMYFTTASFAWLAPKPAELDIETKGSTKIHKTLAYVHVPLMILTPILGGLAKQQRDNGERVHGAANYHGLAAGALLVSYLASIAVMSFNF